MISRPSDEYDILDQFHSQPRKLKIIHVGAGASGLLLAYKSERQLRNYELTCYEKNPNIGGTWWENRYPGCACDIPAHTYTYTFQPKTNWSGFYSYSDEIQSYFEQFYKQHNLSQYVQLNTEVVSATWDSDSYEWMVELRKGGETFTNRCDVLINGSGVVNKWKWPAIEGIDSYKGKLAHSANWDTSIDWKDKKVAVLGTGSSSIQMVPHLAAGSRQLTVFARNPTYIAPQIASDEQKVDPNGQVPGPASKHHYIEAEKEKFKCDPDFHLEYRKKLESALTEMFPLFIRGSELNQKARKGMRESMLQKLGPGHDDLKQRLIPEWSPGCRRLTPGEGYLETLTKSHVRVVHDEIVRFTEQGLVTAAGEQLEFDIIACATGFNVAYVPHFKITGRDGIIMQNAWKETPNIYLSITAPQFPNYFVVNGPTGNWGQGCALPSHEVQLEYALQCCRKIQEEGILSMEPLQGPTTQINQHLDAWHKKYSVWAEDCRSWYKDNKPHGRVYVWPGSMLHHLKTLRTPRYEHYNIRYASDNVWAFLGNGRTDLEIEHEKGRQVDLAPYIRNQDVPWTLDLPRESL